MKIILTLLFGLLIFSCTEKNLTQKFLGKWEKISDPTIHCEITQSGRNFILEYSQAEYTTGYDGYITHPASNETMPVFYDKSKDKLLIKWRKDIDAIYDENTNQIIFESWGAFKKVN